MNRLGRAVRRYRATGDDGVGLILVIGTMTVLMTLIIVTLAIADRSLTSARKHDSFAVALSSAESGIDQVIARVQSSYDEGAVLDDDPDCSAAEVDFPDSVTITEDEIAWAKDVMVDRATVDGCLHDVANGQYVAFKPNGRQAVYAMGWSPGFDHPNARSRAIKTEYIFSPYRPANAILTGGDLEISSSTLVTSATDAATGQASVHSNGNVVVGGGNPTVTGTVTQTGDGPLPSSNRFMAGSARAPKQGIPTVRAAAVYRQQVNNYLGAWYDLCPDGTARSGSSSGTPCTGPVLGSYAGGGSGDFRNGWRFRSGAVPTWQVTGGFLDGVYYVHQGNVEMGNGVGNPSVARATVLVSAQKLSCAKVGGDIDWSHVDIGAPYIDNLFMLAEQDLRTHSNFTAGSASGGTVISGMFIVGDQVDMATSSSGAYGSVIAADECDPPGSMVSKNVVKNPSIYFDPTGYAPFTDVVNTTLWLELVG